MEFYKISATIGHLGAGKSAQIILYVYAENISDAIRRVKNMPMVKHEANLPITKIILVSEDEFFKNSIYNPYFDFVKGLSVDEITSLDELCSRLWYLFESNYRLTSSIGKKMKELYESYTRASKKVQKRLDKEYKLWAETEIQKTKDEGCME